MEKRFEIKRFERLECSSDVLKGGFSPAYAGGALAAVSTINIICPNKNCPSCTTTSQPETVSQAT